MNLLLASCQLHLTRVATGLNPARDPAWFVTLHTPYRIKTKCAECDAPAHWLIGLENRTP